METENPRIQQHEPLRVPAGWGTQEKRFVAQLEEILDDVYRRFGRLKLSDMSTALRQTISDAEGNATQALQTAQGFEQRVQSAEGNATQAMQTANGFEQRVSNAEGNASNALQTVSSFEQRVQSAEGNASKALQTAQGFEQRVQSAEGNATSAKQTADALEGKVVTKDGVVAAINASPEGVVIKGNKVALEGTITANNNFEVRTDGSVKAKNGEFDGILKAGNWKFDSNGSSYENGGIGTNMTVLSGDFVGSDSHGTRAFYGSSNCDVQYGADYEHVAYLRAGAIKLITHKDLNGNWAMDTYGTAYCRLSSGGEFSFLCGEASDGSPRGNLGSNSQRWDTLYVNALHQGSSKHVKHNIKDMPDMGSVIDNLRPVTFVYNNDKAGRTQYGLIYEEAIDTFAHACLPWTTNDVNDIGIDYTRLIMPMLKEMQSLRRRVAELEDKLR